MSTKVKLHWTLLPVALLVAWELAVGLLPIQAPGYPARSYWLIAGLVTVAFFGALLLHELAHAAVARRHGQRVRGITLWLFGGVAELEGDSTSPGAEFRTAVVGPLASLAVAVVFGGLYFLLHNAGSGALLVVAVGWLAVTNALLAAFNLIPAFPLDGGRVLRAALWRLTGDRSRATSWAAETGRVLGGVMIGVGAAGFFFFGWGFTGIWLAVIGMFIGQAARQQLRAVQSEVGLGGLTAGELVAAPPAVAAAHLSVAELVDRWMRPYRLPFCALGESSGELVGVVTEDAIRRLPADAWSLTSARRIAVPLGELVTCQSSEPLAPVAGRLAGSMVPGALVFDGTRLVGVITADDLRYAALRGQARTNASWPSGRGPVVEHPGKP